MIAVWHMKRDMPEAIQLGLVMPGGDSAKRGKLAYQAFFDGHYERVAEIASDRLDEAYRLTQNGVASPSWSLEPPPGLTACEPNFHLHRGERYGRKSSQVGDIFERAGTLYLCADIGFAALGPAPLTG